MKTDTQPDCPLVTRFGGFRDLRECSRGIQYSSWQYYTCKRTPRRWTLTLFHNSFEIALLNGFVLWQTKTESTLNRKKRWSSWLKNWVAIIVSDHARSFKKGFLCKNRLDRVLEARNVQFMKYQKKSVERMPSNSVIHVKKQFADLTLSRKSLVLNVKSHTIQ